MEGPQHIAGSDGRAGYKKLKLYKDGISNFLDELGDLYSDIAIRGIINLLTPNSDLRERVLLITKKCEDMGMYNTAALLGKFYEELNKKTPDYTVLVGIYNSLLTGYHLLRNKFNFITAETGEPSDVSKIVRSSAEIERDASTRVTVSVIPISLWTGIDNRYLLISYDYKNGKLVLIEGIVEMKKRNNRASYFKSYEELIEFYSHPIELRNVILNKLRDGDKEFPPIYGVRHHIGTVFLPIKEALPEIYDRLTDCGVAEKFDPSIPIPELSGLKIGNSGIMGVDAAVLWCLVNYILKAYISKKPFFLIFRDSSKVKKFNKIVHSIFKNKYNEGVGHPLAIIIPDLELFYYSGINFGGSVLSGPLAEEAVDILGKFYRTEPPSLYYSIFSDPDEVGEHRYLTNLSNLWKQIIEREEPDWYIVYTLIDRYYKNGGKNDKKLLERTHKKIINTVERFKSAPKIGFSDIIGVCWATAIIKNFTFLRFTRISEKDLNLILDKIGENDRLGSFPFDNTTTLFEKFLKRNTIGNIGSDIPSHILWVFESFIIYFNKIKSKHKNNVGSIIGILSEIYYILSPILLMWDVGDVIHFVGKELGANNNMKYNIISNSLSYLMYFASFMYYRCENVDDRLLYDKLTVLISDISAKLRIMMEFPSR